MRGYTDVAVEVRSMGMIIYKLSSLRVGSISGQNQFLVMIAVNMLEISRFK